MREFQFPYDRIGERNHLGRTKAMVLAGQDAEYLKAEAEDGVWAYKKGPYLEVEDESTTSVGTSAFLSLGREGAAFRTRTSPSARGDFTIKVASTFVPSNGDGAWLQLVPLDAGYAGVYSQFVTTGYVADFLGLACPQTEVTWFETKDGTMRAVQTFVMTGSRLSSLGAIIFGGRIQQAATNSDDGGAAYADGKWWTSFAFDGIDGDGQHYVAFVRYEARNTGAFYAAIVRQEPGQIVKMIGLHRIGPKAFLLVTVGVVASTGPTGGYDPHNAPPMEWHMSIDNGVTWDTLGTPTFIADILAIMAAQLAGNHWPTYNLQYSDCAIHSAALDRDRILISIHIPVGIHSFAVVKGILSISARAIQMVDRVNFDTEADAPNNYLRALIYFERGMMAVPGGVLIFRSRQGIVNLDEHRTMPFTIGFTATGAEPGGTHDSPGIAKYVGTPTMVSPKQMVVPVFDGAYSLYESRDLGATWTKRATLSPDTTPPAQYGYGTRSKMENFNRLTMTRVRGVGANPTPQTPWFSDERIAAP